MCIACTALALGWNALSPAVARDNDEAKRVQQQMREMEKQAEASRREAERAARRMEAEARQRQREAEQRQREAAREAREAERAARSNPQTPKSDASAKPTAAKTETSNTTDKSKSGDDKKSDKTSDRENDKKDDKTKDGDESEKAETEIDAGPPATVEQWLKRLGTPSKTTSDAPVDVPAKDKVPPQKLSEPEPTRPGTPPKTVPAAPPVAAKASPPTDRRKFEPIVFPDFRPEVLAVNATPQVIERAKSLGFKTSSATSLSSLSLTVTRLLVPSGMSSTDAQALLTRDMPKSNFAPNQKYRIYRTAGTSASQPAGVRSALPGPNAGQACDGDRCFGRNVIGWSPLLASCASGVKIGVIDTSVDLTHPAFNRKKPVIKHLGRSGMPGPDWHGTGVTALLAGDTSGGTPGLIPDAAFFIADIFYADDDNEPASDTVSMLRAFDWLESKGVKIVNMSLSGPPDDLIRKAVEKLSAKGVMFVAAAGNEGPHAGPSYPAAYDNVIAVTAVTKDLQNYRYANRGSYIDVAAPGVAIYTALPGAMEGYHSGTSFAAPYVTATLAALYPQLATKTAGEAMRHFNYKDLGEPGPDPVFGQGLVVAPNTCSGSEMAGAPGIATEPAAIVRTASPPKSADTSDLPWLGYRPSGD